jgi:hypothetical protein
MTESLPPSSSPKTRRGARRKAEVIEIAASRPLAHESDLAFLAREFIMCTLPHSDPGEVPVWSRTNGVFTLRLYPGTDEQGRSYGLPYGPLPRLLLAWIITEAIRTGSPKLYVGRSFSEFMGKLGLSAYTGRGVRGDDRRLRDQMRRLFYCLISFEYSTAPDNRVRVRMLPVESDTRYFDRKGRLMDEDEICTIELGERFFKAVTAYCVPLDVRVLHYLKGSPLALDLYAVLNREAFRAQQSSEDRFLAWEWLHEQLGSEYATLKNFRAKCLPHLQEIVKLCPALGISVRRGGRGRKSGLEVSRHAEPSAAPRLF